MREEVGFGGEGHELGVDFFELLVSLWEGQKGKRQKKKRSAQLCRRNDSGEGEGE